MDKDMPALVSGFLDAVCLGQLFKESKLKLRVHTPQPLPSDPAEFLCDLMVCLSLL